MMEDENCSYQYYVNIQHMIRNYLRKLYTSPCDIVRISHGSTNIKEQNLN